VTDEGTFHADASRDMLVAEAADEYERLLEQGQRPDIEDFARRYPRVADVLRRVLPVLAALDAPEGDTPVRELGDFRIRRELGRGGMGVVYEAEQLSLGRHVALKVLPFAAVMDPRQLQRFKNEAQAAAHLHHTHIVPVYSIGCERGVHYYAMQYIEGPTVADMIAQLRTTAGKDMRGSSALEAVTKGKSTQSEQYCRGVARLGIQAAAALDHAHQQGVVHRDIKPANLIVDAGGHLWITDFGLASFTNNPGLTMTGDIVGTVRYMSPEQALAKRVPVDHRTDIYSLGITLYELLTLEGAFQGDDAHQVIQEIAFKEPRPARGLNPAVSDELETILIKAIAKDPTERYATAQELADDLQRFLDHKPIEAHRPGLAKRAAKWARRHRTLTAAATILLVLTVVGLAASTLLIASEQRRTAAQKRRADANFETARKAVDEMLTAVADEDLAGVPWMVPLRHELLERALAFYETFLAKRTDDPAIRLDTALAWRRVAGVQQLLGRKDDADRSLARAVALLEATDGAELELAITLRRAAEYDRSLAVLEDLVARFPARTAYRHQRARSIGAQALSLQATGDLDGSEQGLRRAHEIAAACRRADPDETSYLQTIATVALNLGMLLLEQGKTGPAERWLLEALGHYGELARRDPEAPGPRNQVAATQTNLWALYKQTGNAKRGAQHVLELRAIYEQLEAEFPTVPKYRHQLARQLINEALIVEQKDPGAAERNYRAAIARVEALLGLAPDSAGYAATLATGRYNLATLLARTQRREAAEQAFLQSIDGWSKLAERFPARVEYRAELAKTHRWRADLWVGGRDPARMRESFRRAIELLEEIVTRHENPEYRLTLLQALGDYSGQLPRRRRAEKRSMFERAAALARQLAEAHPERPWYGVLWARMLVNVATTFAGEDPARQLALFEQARAQCASLVGEGRRGPELLHTHADTWQRIAMVQASARRLAEAEQACRKAVALQDELAKEHPGRPDFRAALAKSCWLLGDLLVRPAAIDERRKAYARAAELYGELVREGARLRSDYGGVLHQLGLVLLMQGEHAEALRCFERAIPPQLAAWRAAPGNPRVRAMLQNHFAGAAGTAAQSGDHARGAATARKLLEHFPREVPVLVRVADLIDRCAEASTEESEVARYIEESKRLRVQALGLLDDDAAAYNEFAWVLAIHPDTRRRDPKLAVELARKAVGLDAEQGNYWNTLGVALCRAGSWQDGAKALEKSMALRNGGDAFDWYFLAMAKWHLGDKAAARALHARAIEWTDSNAQGDRELRRFREEAEELLKQ
jgi:tetratricopeptide (TPR) repeat protein/tRNA A-37 threonylcarbamoyl transferase component Bud32